MWVDLEGLDLDGWQDTVDGFLAGSPIVGAEEWFISDHEGTGTHGVDEFPNMADVFTLAHGIAVHGPAFTPFFDIAEEWGIDPDNAIEAFTSHYQGEWASWSEFAEHQATELFHEAHQIADATPYLRFDDEAFARDLAADYHVAAAPTGVWVFTPHS